MAVAERNDLQAYCLEVAQRAKQAAAALAAIGGTRKNQWLHVAARLLRENVPTLQLANDLDVAAAGQFGLSAAQIDRLRLTPKVVESMAASLEAVAEQSDPIGEVIESSIRPNGLEVRKVRVPLGVIFFIYESRPNVTSDAAAIAIKSGNAIILRGGKEAAHSNQAVADLLAAAARSRSAGRRRAAGDHDRSGRRRPVSGARATTSTWRFRAAARV